MRGHVVADAVVLELPFRGLWLARNSPARRVPSHGTHLFGVTHAIDFVAVDESGLPAPRTWRTAFATERPETFRGFGLPILSPVPGEVVAVHDGEPDHVARRSQVALVPYAAGQAGRVRRGITAVAGNHVVIALRPGGPYVGLAHLRRGTVRPAVGDAVMPGQPLGECGNSGNSTQPHVHVQVSDSLDWHTARGVPMVFRRPRARALDETWMPAESEIVDGGPA